MAAARCRRRCRKAAPGSSCCPARCWEGCPGCAMALGSGRGPWTHGSGDSARRPAGGTVGSGGVRKHAAFQGCGHLYTSTSKGMVAAHAQTGTRVRHGGLSRRPGLCKQRKPRCSQSASLQRCGAAAQGDRTPCRCAQVPPPASAAATAAVRRVLPAAQQQLHTARFFVRPQTCSRARRMSSWTLRSSVVGQAGWPLPKPCWLPGEAQRSCLVCSALPPAVSCWPSKRKTFLQLTTLLQPRPAGGRL